MAALLRALKKLGLTTAAAKCRNFVVGGISREVIQHKDDWPSGAKRRHKEQHIQRTSQDLERLRRKMSGEREFELPFPLTYRRHYLETLSQDGTGRLGLDCNWTSRRHYLEMRERLAKRLHVLTKKSNAVWDYKVEY